MRPLVSGRIIAVFGSAGERDQAKRPMQGRIASEYADILILTDEDPRLEDPVKILREIADGSTGHDEGKDLFLIPDRKEATVFAFRMAREGDTVLLLGKGHENSIIYPDGPHCWDEEEVARAMLGEIGYKQGRTS